MKKKTVIGLAAAAAAAAAAYGINRQSEHSDYNRYRDVFGKFVEVKGHQLSYEDGGEGETIVALCGLGETSPIMSWRPLAACLRENYRVIILEPFGYGYSDDIDEKRNLENITEELHLALEALQVKEYVLMAHSFGGVYALKLMQDYPEEVKAYIGIDTIVPQVAQYLDATVLNQGMHYLNKGMGNLGILKVMTLLDESKYVPLTEDYHFSDTEKDICRAVALYRQHSAAIANELSEANASLKKVLTFAVPDSIPAYFYTATESDELLEKYGALEATWTHYHKILTNHPLSKVQRMVSSHYIHHENVNSMQKEIKAWLKSL